MRRNWKLFLAALAVALVGPAPSYGVDLLAPGNLSVAIDLDSIASSGFPALEGPGNAIDGTNAKYLNTGGANSGVIVSPVAYVTGGLGTTYAPQSMRIRTANDATARDPATYQVYGTLADPLVSTSNSTGLGEAWTLIGSGALACPVARNTDCPVVSFPNTDAFLHYKVVFPTLRTAGTPLMQIAEVSLYESLDGSGTDFFTAGDPVLAIDAPGPTSSSPGAEGPANAIDGRYMNLPAADPLSHTKYLNFGENNAGLILKPGGTDPSIVTSFVFTTANDAPARDPAGWALSGTNDPITSAQHSLGNNENWVPIASGTVDLPLDRYTVGPEVSFANSTPYTAYRMVVTSVRDAAAANSVQFAEIQLRGQIVPEPSSVVLALLGLAGAGLAYRRRK